MNDGQSDAAFAARAEIMGAMTKYLDFCRQKETTFYMVLSDGETFTALDGCMIVQCPDVWETEQIELALAGDEDEDDPAFQCRRPQTRLRF